MASIETREPTWELFRSAIDTSIAGSPRFPDGSAFVAADAPHAGRAVARYHDEGWPVVLVDSDGSHRLLPVAAATKAAAVSPETQKVGLLLVGLALVGLVLWASRGHGQGARVTGQAPRQALRQAA